jgi:hypothetical protein
MCASECGALAYYRKALSKYKRDLLSARAPFSNYVETGMAKNERILYDAPTASIAMQLTAHLKKNNHRRAARANTRNYTLLLATARAASPP